MCEACEPIKIRNHRNLFHRKVIGDMALRGFQCAEAAAECDLAFVIEILPGEHQHGVSLESIFDFRKGGAIQRACEIDASDFRAEHRSKLPNSDGHGGSLLVSNAAALAMTVDQNCIYDSTEFTDNPRVVILAQASIPSL